VPDDPSQLGPLLVSLCDQHGIDAVLMTGGTGVSSRDQTYETVTNLLTKPIPGYGELFRMLSFEVIGPAAMLSRATGGVLNRTVVLTMPGSPAAISLAMEKIILPELGHLVREARR
jgi:molybdenum cofactor biosynthesis protein B